MSITLPRKVIEKMSPKRILIYFFMGLSITLFSAIFIIYLINREEKKVNNTITIKVTLENNCSLIDDSFMLLVEPGQKYYFNEGIATVTINPGAMLRVINSDKYPGFQFSTKLFRVEKNIKIPVTCDSQGRIEDTLDALRSQFQQKKSR